MSRSVSRLSLLAVAMFGVFALPAVGQDREPKPTRRILALGGAGFKGFNNVVPRYFLSLIGKKNPVV